MPNRIFTVSAGLTLIIAVAACEQPAQPKQASEAVASPGVTPLNTAASGSVSTLVGRGTIANPFAVLRVTGGWRLGMHSDPMDVATQTIVFSPGAQSGWHKHPGPVFILVTEGTMTFYEANDPQCKPTVRTAGQGYFDAGDDGHIARNETHHDAKNLVTYFAPVGAALRIDMPAPGNCPF